MKIVKQRPLLPTLREKKRYLVYEVISEDRISQNETQKIISSEFEAFVGRLGSGKAGLIFLKDWMNNKGIVRINNKYLDYLKASLCDIRKENMLLKSVGVSGILKQARSKYFGGR